MKHADFHPEADVEAQDALLHYQAIRKRLGVEFRSELRAALKRARTNPCLYAADELNLRIVPLRRFPYIVVFEILDDRIWIAAVAHTSRRYGYCSKRRRNDTSE